jgi:DNA-binding HxlR family transcriptional regulator
MTSQHDPPSCEPALARAFGFLGKRWNGVLIGSLVGGPAGFAQLGRSVAGISESVLSDRLSELTKAGVIARVVHDGPPVSVTYELTACGEALLPALRALARWAQESLPEPAPEPEPEPELQLDLEPVCAAEAPPGLSATLI